MSSGRDGNGRRRTADESAVNFNICARRSGLDYDTDLNLGTRSSARWCWRSHAELGHFKVHVAFDKSSDFGSLRNGDVFSVHEEK